MGVDLVRNDLMGVPWCDRETIMRKIVLYTYILKHTSVEITENKIDGDT